MQPKQPHCLHKTQLNWSPISRLREKATPSSQLSKKKFYIRPKTKYSNHIRSTSQENKTNKHAQSPHIYTGEKQKKSWSQLHAPSQSNQIIVLA